MGLLTKIKGKFAEFKSRTVSLTDAKAWVFGYDDALMNGLGRVAAVIAWQYYNKIAPISRAVNLISQEFKNIPPILFDIASRDFITAEESTPLTQQIMEKLARPNEFQNKQDFFDAICKSYKVTGEAFIKYTGVRETELSEMFFVNPRWVETTDDASDPTGQPLEYRVQTETRLEVYTKRLVDGRYFNESGLAELCHLSKFNPFASSTNNRGRSDLTPLFADMEEYFNTKVHNVSMLKKGARPSGALHIKGRVEKSVLEMMKEQARLFYSGSNNAGNMMVFQGDSVEFKELSMNSKDMDFSELLAMAKASLYESYNIPHSFFDNSKSTNNNKEQDREGLYDFAVLPVSAEIYGFLTRTMFRWFKGADRYLLTAREEDIPALRGRFLKNLKEKKELDVLTDNEIRTDLGREGYEGGDTHYKPATLLPVGEDGFTEDNRNEPKTKALLLADQKTKLEESGLFSDEEINQVMNEAKSS